jgi:hypothetical protein
VLQLPSTERPATKPEVVPERVSLMA